MITIMNTRLKQFIAAENISQSQFADTIKVVRASVSHVLAGRNKPGYDFIKAIMLAYPHLNMEWLIIGKGKMYKSASETMEQPLTNAQNASIATEDDMPLLFDYEQDSEQLTEDVLQMAVPDILQSPQIPAATQEQKQTKALYNVPESTEKQRKAIRIAVFYNDGTYQEFQGF